MAIQELIEAELATLIGAQHGQRTPTLATQRNDVAVVRNRRLDWCVPVGDGPVRCRSQVVGLQKATQRARGSRMG